MKNVVAVACLLLAVRASHGAAINYNNGGANWATGTPANALCASGQNQSPINIAYESPKVQFQAGMPVLNFTYQPSVTWTMLATQNYLEVELIDVQSGPGVQYMATSTSGNGITLPANTVTQSGGNAAGLYLPLNQFHFHSPSENTINGVHYPLEMHMVHKLFATPSNTSSALVAAAVIGVMFKLDPNNANSTFVDQLVQGPLSNTTFTSSNSTIPSEDTETAANAQFDMMKEVFTAALVDPGKYFKFQGSLTTPPCTENVNWFVMAQPMTISTSQLAGFLNALANRQGGNSRGGDNRDIQPLNSRSVVASFRYSAAPAARTTAALAASCLVAAALALAF